MTRKGLVVEKVSAGGIAHRLGVEPGDWVVEINGQPVRDVLDYRFLSCAEKLNVLVVKAGGESWLLDLEKEYEDDLGLSFGARELGRGFKRCRNKCVFCFLDQLPGGLRRSLYFNDDDYRLSFLHGNFITLTNVSRGELERIAGQRLSPLYISVHTTNPALREKMLNNPRAGKIMEQLRFLAGAGIEMHAQAVLCPGINDGPELERTITDLCGFWPAVRSLAAVPVGLTRYRDQLAPLRGYNQAKAREITGLVRKWQRICRRRVNNPFVFAADEFYLRAREPVPPAKDYAGFPQLENGVGLVRLFQDEWAAAAKKLPAGLKRPRKVTVVTGELGMEILKPVVQRLNAIENLEVQLIGVTNRFFGETVTVAGLLTARDVLAALAGRALGDLLIVPAVMLREQDDLFLDGPSLGEFARRLGVPAVKAKGARDLSRLATGKAGKGTVLLPVQY